MYKLIPKANVDESNYPCWIETIDSSGNHVKPAIRCACGDYFGLRKHSVSSMGIVSPSVFHSADMPNGCGWHEFIILEHWSGESFEAGES